MLDHILSEYRKHDQELSTSNGAIIRKHVNRLLKFHNIHDGVITADITAMICAARKSLMENDE